MAGGAVCGGVSSPVAAQVPSTHGGLKVTVRDQTGAVITGATVVVKLLARNWSQKTTTDGNGEALFPGLLPGDYAVSVSAPDLTPETANVTVLLGHQAALSFELVPVAVREEITVTAPTEAPVDSSTIPVHTHISNSEINQLPINQRNYLDFSLLDSSIQRDTLRVHAVAVTSGFNVMGQRPRNNSIQLDGADLNDESTGGARGSLSMEAIQEFQVLTNGYQAEYGRASGGVVNAISKSGTNQFHGDVFGFLRQRDLDATNAFSPVKDPPYTRTQYGASLGGPIWRDHSFFFLAFEQLRRQESGFSQIGTNPATFSLTPEQEALKALDPTSPAIVAAERGLAIARDGIDPATGAPPDYPITPLGNLPGIYPVSQRLGTYSIRIDHALTPANRLALRFNYGHDRQSALEASNNDQIAGLLAPGRTARLTTLDPTAVLSLSSTFGPATINDARFSWAARQFEMNPNSRGTSVNIPGSAFLGREPILPHIRTERHWHIEDTMMLSRGPHLVKFGGDAMFCPTTVDYHRQLEGLFNFGPVPAPGTSAGAPLLTPVQAYGLGLPRQFVQQFGNPKARSGKTSTGLFIQDTWRITPRLSLDLGTRYDVEFTHHVGITDAKLQPVFDALAIRRSPPTDRNNIQPRFGFSYQVARNGKLTVRGSYGIFYDRLLNLATYLARVGDGGQIQRAILSGEPAVDVFHLPGQKLAEYPGTTVPTALLAFSRGWALGKTQQGNFLVNAALKPDLSLDVGYVWVRGTHLPRSRDYNPPDPHNSFLRPHPEISEAMAFEDSASSTYHGLRVNLRGRLNSRATINASYTFSKAIDDAEEIFPHTRNQNMFDFRADRGLALYDQRHRFVLSLLYDSGTLAGGPSIANRIFGNWVIAPIIEVGSGRPVNVLLGFDNNRDGYPSSDRPDVVPPGTPGSVTTPYGTFLAPPSGVSGNLGRNVFVGPGFASFNLRLQKNVQLGDRLSAEFLLEGFNLFNRINVRSVNPNFKHAGDPLSAFDPRQIQLGLRLRF